MHCPRLADLPPPASGRTGWPWTVETPPSPPTRPDGGPWPRISIVTPSYNQGQFIEETIRSILLQGYPDLEYIIIDGGSTDQSVDIIKKYEPWLTYWVSEKDRGQVHAINKGLAKSSGEIFQWINSDDVLLFSAIPYIATAFSGDAVATPVLVGKTGRNSITLYNRDLTIKYILHGRAIFSQPGLWLPTSKLELIEIREDLHYAFDWDMLIRILGEISKRDVYRVSFGFLSPPREFKDYARRSDVCQRRAFNTSAVVAFPIESVTEIYLPQRAPSEKLGTALDRMAEALPGRKIRCRDAYDSTGPSKSAAQD